VALSSRASDDHQSRKTASGLAPLGSQHSRPTAQLQQAKCFYRQIVHCHRGVNAVKFAQVSYLFMWQFLRLAWKYCESPRSDLIGERFPSSSFAIKHGVHDYFE
jgi:hypothetical protein